MNKSWIKLLLSAILLGCVISCGKSPRDSQEMAQEDNASKFNNTDFKDDVNFVIAAADGAMLEIMLGQVAQQNANSQDVKDFGIMMVNDHSKGNDELKKLADVKNITLPERLGKENQKTFDEISGKAGREFDEAYMEYMVKDHKNDIDLFKKEADKGMDPEIKAWAAGKVAVLEHHLDMAKQEEKQLADRD